jgi:hypothetical protein
LSRQLIDVAPATDRQTSLTLVALMAGGGKGGKQSTSVTVPAWLEQAAQGNLARADELAKIGYTPFYGPDVAAMTPAQVAAMQGTNAASQAFGLGGFDPMAGMPQAQNFGGMQGYSSGGLYDQALAALEARAPGQFAALRAPFINPVTGAQPASPFGSAPPAAPGMAFGMANPNAAMMSGEGEGRDMMGYGGGPASASPGGMGGYSGFGDMFDGGGPGASGDRFSGGPYSGLANFAGVDPIGSRDSGPSGMGGGK